MITKLIVTLTALWILVPAIAFAGGGGFDQEQQMAQKTIVIENHVPTDDGKGIIIASVIGGVFTLVGTIYMTRRKS